MAGRPPTPTALKVITGNPGKRPLNKNEPTPPLVSDIAAPEWMPPDARAVWDEIAPKLLAAGLLTEVDVDILAAGCVSIAQYRRAVRAVGDDMVKTKTVVDCSGEPAESSARLSPWMVAQSMAFKQAMAVFQQFGMSPVARTRVAVQPQSDIFGRGDEEKRSAKYF